MKRAVVIAVALAAVLGGLGAESLTAATPASGCPKVPKPKSQSRERKPPKKSLDPGNVFGAGNQDLDAQ